MPATKTKRPTIRIEELPKLAGPRWYAITVEGETPVSWVQQGKPTKREVMARVARVEREREGAASVERDRYDGRDINDQEQSR
jgi:hypothetical protein